MWWAFKSDISSTNSNICHVFRSISNGIHQFWLIDLLPNVSSDFFECVKTVACHFYLLFCFCFSIFERYVYSRMRLPDELKATSTISIDVFGFSTAVHNSFDFLNGSGAVFMSTANGARMKMSSKYLRTISCALYL